LVFSAERFPEGFGTHEANIDQPESKLAEFGRGCHMTSFSMAVRPLAMGGTAWLFVCADSFEG
jgi:hypothetical protein